MATQLHNSGEQFQLEKNIGETTVDSVTVGLFHDGEVSADTDAGDDLADADDYSAISTEPSGAAYNTLSLTLNGTDFTVSENGSGNFEMATAAQHSFDLSDDDSGVIDAYYVVVNFDDGGGTAEDHLYWTGNLSQQYDVASVGTLDIEAGGIGLSLD